VKLPSSKKDDKPEKGTWAYTRWKKRNKGPKDGSSKDRSKGKVRKASRSRSASRDKSPLALASQVGTPVGGLMEPPIPLRLPWIRKDFVETTKKNDSDTESNHSGKSSGSARSNGKPSDKGKSKGKSKNKSKGKHKSKGKGKGKWGGKAD
jgi:hypothetical protein